MIDAGCVSILSECMFILVAFCAITLLDDSCD